MTVTASAKASKATGILLLLFASSILISQSLMDLLSTLLCLYLGFQWVSAKIKKTSFQPVQKMGFDWLWVAWFFIAALGFVLNAPPPETPAHFWVARLVEFKWILILYFMVGALRVAPINEKAVRVFATVALLCSAYALVAYYFELKTVPESRLGGLFNFSMTYAHSYGIVFCALCGFVLMLWTSLPKGQIFFYLFSILILGISVLLTYTRGIWLAVFVTLIVISFLSRLRNGFISIFLCLLMAVGLYSFSPSIRNRIDFTKKVADSEQAKDSYDTERLVLWNTNLMIFKDHPWFGSGYGQNKFLLREYYAKQNLPQDQFIGHAHNQYLHLLAGTGLLGLLCYIGILVTFATLTLRAFWRIPKEKVLPRALALAAFGGQLCLILGGITESNFEHSKVRFAMMLMWALGLYLWQEYRHAK